MEAVCIPDILQGHVLDEWNKGTEQSFQSRYQYWIRLLAENCGNTGADTGHASEIYLGPVSVPISVPATECCLRVWGLNVTANWRGNGFNILILLLN